MAGQPARSGGHNQKPTAIKILEGNPGKRPLPDREPTPVVGIPRPPKWLRKDARGYWRTLARQLASMGVLTEVDGQALATLCNVEAEYADALKRPEDWKHLADVDKRHMQYLQQFGLTPSSRAKVKVEKQAQPKDDPWLGLLN